MAYGSCSAIENMGTVFIYWILFFLHALFVKLLGLSCCPLNKFDRFKKYNKKLSKALFWSSFINFAIAVYIEGAVSSQINIRCMFEDRNVSQVSSVHNIISLIYAILLGLFLVLFPIVAIVFLVRNRDEMYLEFHDRTKYITAYRTNKSQTQMDERFAYYRKYNAIYAGIKLRSHF